MSDFLGAEICCGTYACMNCLAEQGIRPIPDWKEFEIASSVPFGLRYMERVACDRMLTPFVNPAQGIDRAARIWGYQVERWSFPTEEAAVQWMEAHPEEGPFVAGPVDMGALGYLPLSSRFQNIDHYITISVSPAGEADLMDSEYAGRIPCSWENLKRFLRIGKVPEAEGNLTVRSLKAGAVRPRRERLLLSFIGAGQNLARAREAGQGPLAFERCCHTIETTPPYIWKNSLLYEVSYVMQRKYLFLKLLKACCLEEILSKKDKNEIGQALNCQIQVLAELAGGLKFGKPSAGIFHELEQWELEITRMMEAVALPS